MGYDGGNEAPVLADRHCDSCRIAMTLENFASLENRIAVRLEWGNWSAHAPEENPRDTATNYCVFYNLTQLSSTGAFKSAPRSDNQINAERQ